MYNRKTRVLTFLFKSGEKFRWEGKYGFKGIRDSKGRRPIDFYTEDEFDLEELNDILNCMAGGIDVPGRDRVYRMMKRLDNEY